MSAHVVLQLLEQLRDSFAEPFKLWNDQIVSHDFGDEGRVPRNDGFKLLKILKMKPAVESP